MDLVPLLYPGVRRIHGVYRVYPFYESDLLNKASEYKSYAHEVNQRYSKGKEVYVSYPLGMFFFSFLF